MRPIIVGKHILSFNAERVYIGGIRKLDSKNATVLDNTDLAEVTFKARSEGHSNVDFLFKPDDTTESNIVLTSSKDGLGDVKGTDIYVGKKVALTTDSAVVVPNVNFRLTLKNITTESAQIDIALGNQTDTKKFTWGWRRLYKITVPKAIISIVTKRIIRAINLPLLCKNKAVVPKLAEMAHKPNTACF
jgi:ferredoxin-fold anticodon binding domain-containing protein